MLWLLVATHIQHNTFKITTLRKLVVPSLVNRLNKDSKEGWRNETRRQIKTIQQHFSDLIVPRNYATASVNLFNDRINRGLSVPGSEFLIMFFIYYLSKINKLYTYFQPEQKPYSTLPIMYQPFPPYNQFVPQGGPAAPIHYQSQVPPMPHPASNIAPPVQRPTQTEQPKVVVLGKKQIISKK